MPKKDFYGHLADKRIQILFHFKVVSLELCVSMKYLFEGNC